MKKQKIPQKLKKLVLEALRRHAWNIGVSHFRGDILWMQEDKKNEEGELISAEMRVDRRYLNATLKIYPIAIKDWQERGDEHMESVVAHEVAHIATEHLRQMAISTYKDSGELEDAWETLTEVVGRLSTQIDNLLRKKK